LETSAVLERLKKATGLRKEKDIARLLGISAQDFSNRKRRETLWPLLSEWARKEGISLDWLLSGAGEMRQIKRPGEIREGAASYSTPDYHFLCRAVEAVEKGLDQGGNKLGPNQKARLIVAVYDMLAEGKEVDFAMVKRLIRLAG